MRPPPFLMLALSPTLMFLERRQAGPTTSETWFPIVTIDSGTCPSIQGHKRRAKLVGPVNRNGTEGPYSDDGLWRVLYDLPAMQVSPDNTRNFSRAAMGTIQEPAQRRIVTKARSLTERWRQSILNGLRLVQVSTLPNNVHEVHGDYLAFSGFILCHVAHLL